MNDSPKSNERSWWRTLPGMLTATATLITAITGLIVGLNQIGLFDRGPEVAVDTAVVEQGDESRRSTESGGVEGPGEAGTESLGSSSPQPSAGREGGRLTTTSGAIDFERITAMSMGNGQLTVQQLGSTVEIPLSTIKRISFTDRTAASARSSGTAPIEIEYRDGTTEQAQFDCYWNLPVTFHAGGREFYYGDCGDFAVIREIEFYSP